MTQDDDDAISKRLLAANALLKKEPIDEAKRKLLHLLGDERGRDFRASFPVSNMSDEFDTTLRGLDEETQEQFMPTLEKHGLLHVSIPVDGVERPVGVVKTSADLCNKLCEKGEPDQDLAVALQRAVNVYKAVAIKARDLATEKGDADGHLRAAASYAYAIAEQASDYKSTIEKSPASGKGV